MYRRTMKNPAEILANLKPTKFIASYGDSGNELYPAVALKFAFVAAKIEVRERRYLDKCCMVHRTNRPDNLISYRKFSGNDSFNAGSRSSTISIVDIRAIREKNHRRRAKMKLLKDVGYLHNVVLIWSH